jgi:hypothetical protein
MALNIFTKIICTTCTKMCSARMKTKFSHKNVRMGKNDPDHSCSRMNRFIAASLVLPVKREEQTFIINSQPSLFSQTKESNKSCDSKLSVGKQ